MPSRGHDSSTGARPRPREYTPTDDACTSTGTPAAATASNTRSLPKTFTEASVSGRCDGWMSQARWITASAPRNAVTRSWRRTSAPSHSTFGRASAGAWRAMPSTSSTRSSAASAATTELPTLPVAPVTATLTAGAPS